MVDVLVRGETWFTRKGPDNDVVISSRVRIARNLSDHRFPGAMNAEEERGVQQELTEAFAKLPPSENLEILYLDELKPLERRLLLERNIITQEFSVTHGKAIVLRSTDAALSGMINEEDHLRLSCVREGMALGEAYKEVDRLDTLLEEKVNYAISLEWGYLNPSLHNVGTGMRASFMLHLPALVMTHLIEKALKAISQVGLSVKGYFGDGDASLGDIYQISNQVALGVSEAEIVENLGSIIMPLVDYERKARDELCERRRVDLEDRVYRAYGILTHCKQIASREAMDLLSSLRLGVSLGLIAQVSLETITGLFFLSQKHHIQQLMGEGEENGNTKMLDYTRAKTIREALSSGNILEDSNV